MIRKPGSAPGGIWSARRLSMPPASWWRSAIRCSRPIASPRTDDPALPLDFVEQFRVFEDNDDQGSALAGLLQLLDTLWPHVRYPDGFRADQVAERTLNYGLPPDDIAQELRGLLDVVGSRPLNAVSGYTVGQRLRLVVDNPAVTGSEVLILRKRAARGGKHLPGVYLIEERRKQP